MFIFFASQPSSCFCSVPVHRQEPVEEHHRREQWGWVHRLLIFFYTAQGGPGYSLGRWRRPGFRNIVTGGGIGRTTARLLAEAGAMFDSRNAIMLCSHPVFSRAGSYFFVISKIRTTQVNSARSLRLFLSILTTLLYTGCTVGESEPHPVSWWILGGLGLAVLGGAIAGLLRIQKLRQRLTALEADLDARAARIEQQRNELESLYRADDELRRYLHLDDVLQSLVKTAIELLHAEKGALLVWDEKKEKLIARAAFGFHPETVARISLGPGEGLAGKVAMSGEPAFIEDAQQDGRVTPFIIESEHLRSIMQVPIRVAGEVFGVFSADYVQPHHFSEEEKRLLTAFAQRAGLAIETARLYEREAQIAIMQERNRLARDLHDSVTQSLYGISLYAEVAGQLLRSGELEKATENFQELKGMALDTLAEMRLLIYELRPSVFEQEGLIAAIQARLDSVEGRVGLETNFIIEGKISLPPKIEEGLYRIAQEALNNIIKHAQARTATVTLKQEENAIWLEVADDGVGFNPLQACQAGCMGLHNMQERAKELDAEFEIISQVGSGSKIRVRRQVP